MSDNPFPFRGKILKSTSDTINSSFYLITRISENYNFSYLSTENKTELSSMFPLVFPTNNQTNAAFANLKKLFFVLCVSNNNDSSQRMYFSADPNDFEKDLSNNSRSQGAAVVSFEEIKQKIFFRYTNLLAKKDQNGPPVLTYFSQKTNNISKVGSNVNSYVVTRSMDNNTNTGPGMFYGNTGYSITESEITGPRLSWTFRKIETPVSATDNYFSMLQNENFKYSKIETVTIPKNNDNKVYIINKTLYLVTNSPEIVKLPQNKGVLILKNTTNFEIMLYNIMSKVSKEPPLFTADSTTPVYQFKLTNRMLRNSTVRYTDNFNGGEVTWTSIDFNLRNYHTNFSEIDQGDYYFNGRSNEETAANLFSFFAVPTTNDAYFTGGETLKTLYIKLKKNFIPSPNTAPLIYLVLSSKNDTTPSVVANPTLSTQTRINKNVVSLTSSTLMINFWAFYILGKFNTDTHWTNSGLTGYPTLGARRTSNSPGTIFTWNRTLDSLQGYMYDYCEKGQTCGDCWGLNNKNSQICLVTSKTREHVKNLSSTLIDLGIKPLGDSENFHNSHNEIDTGPRNVYVYISTACSGILILFSIIMCFLLAYKKRE